MFDLTWFNHSTRFHPACISTYLVTLACGVVNLQWPIWQLLLNLADIHSQISKWDAKPLPTPLLNNSQKWRPIGWLGGACHTIRIKMLHPSADLHESTALEERCLPKKIQKRTYPPCLPITILQRLKFGSIAVALTVAYIILWSLRFGTPKDLSRYIPKSLTKTSWDTYTPPTTITVYMHIKIPCTYKTWS